MMIRQLKRPSMRTHRDERRQNGASWDACGASQDWDADHLRIVSMQITLIKEMISSEQTSATAKFGRASGLL